MKTPLTGSCQCRSVRYAIARTPLSIYACHCTECQRQSGSAFGTTLLAPREAFAITHGTPKSWLRTADSGRQIDCQFCPDCGTRLVHLNRQNTAFAIVRAGTLDDTSGVHLAGHIWTRSRQPWFEIPAHAVNFEGQPPDFSRLIEAYAAL